MNKKEIYPKVSAEISRIIDSTTNEEKKLQSICRVLSDKIDYFDWVGFYVWNQRTGNLELGSFVGAETEHKIISRGNGICGQVAETKKTMIIQNVTKEQNYLACSLEVQAEIVIPIFKNKKFVAELDIDSHSHAPFSEEDAFFLEKICRKLGKLF